MILINISLNILLILVAFVEFRAEYIDKCEMWQRDHVFNTTERHYYNKTSIIIRFKSFSELSIKCHRLRFKIEMLKFYAERDLFINSDMDIRNMLRLFEFVDDQMIEFMNVRGFNYVTGKAPVNFDMINYMAYFHELIFEFFIDERLVTKEVCFTFNFANNRTNFFGSLRNLVLAEYTRYTKAICPYVFLNTRLVQLSMYGITNSLLLKNQVSFVDINQTSEFDLHTFELNFVQITVAYEEITLKIINKYVFKHMHVFFMSGLITRIQPDLFSYFKEVNSINIKADNFKIFYQSGTSWLHFLNEDLNVDLTKLSEINMHRYRAINIVFADTFSVFKQSYTYPDKDICLFKDFPHKQLVYPTFEFAEYSNECSCTIMWLIQHSKLYVNFNETDYDTHFLLDRPLSFMDESIRYCLTMGNFTESLESCRFEVRLNNCRLDTSMHDKEKFIFTGDINNMFHFKWLEYVVRVFLQPILCLLGILTNSLSVLVVRNKRKVFQNVMYQHIFANSVFNLIYCVIFSFSLINVCIIPHGVFCSRLLKNGFSQYFTIYIIYFLGNAIRLCCNFSYIALSISRFYISTSNPSILFKKFEKLNLKCFYSILLVITLFFSVFKLFQFKPNEFYSSFDENFPFDAYGINYCEFNIYSIKAFAFKCKLFQILNLINNVLDNILFLLISVIIDILLVRFSNELLKNKQSLINSEKHLAQALRYKDTVNKMIITNGTLYFVSHVPEFVITVILIVLKKKLAHFCYYMFSCTKIIEIAQSFNALSISLQFFIFLLFDKNFSRCLMIRIKKYFSSSNKPAIERS